jgi:hypothetical protein
MTSAFSQLTDRLSCTRGRVACESIAELKSKKQPLV